MNRIHPILSHRGITAMLFLAAWGIVASTSAKPGDTESKPPSIAPEEIPSRIIVFGSGRPLGLISVRRTGAGSQEQWQKMREGRAMGKVRVPVGYDVRLDVDPRFAGDLELLSPLTSNDLQMINMADSKVTDVGMSNLAKLTGLKILNLRKNPITDVGVAHLAGMKEMATLYLDDTLITDAGLVHLAGMKNLYHLNLGESAKLSEDKPRRITDAGMEKLAGLQIVNFLDLSGSGVTDSGLKHLAGMSGMYYLNLSGSKITESALAAIGQFHGLSDLNISHTGKITKSGIPALLAMSALGSLTIHKGQISAELLAELKTKRPSLKITELAP